MDDNDSSAAALAIMVGWEWEGWSRFYGQETYGPITRPLSDAVNKLAFDGHHDAAMAILSLLAAGKLVAFGSYEWRAYRGDHYQNAGSGDIPALRWQSLQEGLALSRDKNWRLPCIKFEFLDGFGSETEYSAAEWDWRNDRFSTAQRSPDSCLFEPEYSEELFLASSVEVRHVPTGVVTPEAPPVPEKSAVEKSKGGAPAKYDWERAVTAIVFQWADEGSWQPRTKADVKNKLADWFAEQNQHPSDSLLKDRAGWLFDEFQRRNGEASNLAA